MCFKKHFLLKFLIIQKNAELKSNFLQKIGQSQKCDNLAEIFRKRKEKNIKNGASELVRNKVNKKRKQIKE